MFSVPQRGAGGGSSGSRSEPGCVSHVICVLEGERGGDEPALALRAPLVQLPRARRQSPWVPCFPRSAEEALRGYLWRDRIALNFSSAFLPKVL